MRSLFIDIQQCKEGLLGNLYPANLLHPLFTLFLLFKQLALAADITAIALGQHVFAHG